MRNPLYSSIQEISNGATVQVASGEDQRTKLDKVLGRAPKNVRDAVQQAKREAGKVKVNIVPSLPVLLMLPKAPFESEGEG
jgi:hypothetical protein